MADEFGDAASTPIGSGEKRATGHQASVQRLAHGHLDLLGGRPGGGRVEDRPHRVSNADAFARHDFGRLEGLRRRVQGYTLKPPDTTVVASD
ncbi:MAG: hypothetical protein QOF85_2547 [Solirubrobacterales bacterium]|jgi:hypothetical protein|nr:hypothetical protein [Solirubrobacterales bacterium]